MDGKAFGLESNGRTALSLLKHGKELAKDVSMAVINALVCRLNAKLEIVKNWRKRAQETKRLAVQITKNSKLHLLEKGFHTESQWLAYRQSLPLLLATLLC